MKLWNVVIVKFKIPVFVFSFQSFSGFLFVDKAKIVTLQSTRRILLKTYHCVV